MLIKRYIILNIAYQNKTELVIETELKILEVFRREQCQKTQRKKLEIFHHINLIALQSACNKNKIMFFFSIHI